MEKPISVRVARESDATELSSLTAQLGYQVKPLDLRSKLSHILERSDQRFVVAEDRRRVVGWLHALVVEYVEANPFVVIGGLVVDKNSRRPSAGRTGAHQFYERLGYMNIKTQYSFAKPLDPGGARELSQFIPRIDTQARD